MKMSEKIYLPVSAGRDILDSGGGQLALSERKAAAHAINSHDKLVEGIELAIAEGYMMPTEVLTKLKGLISDE